MQKNNERNKINDIKNMEQELETIISEVENEEIIDIKFYDDNFNNCNKSNLIWAIGKAKVPTKEENLEMVKEYHNGNKAILTDIIVRNGRLVIATVNKIVPTKTKQDEEDYIQEGIIGLITAVKKFNFDFDVSFSTYAMFWIRQHITRYMADKGRTIRLPVHIHDKIYKIKKAERELLSEGDEVDIVKVAEMTSLSVEEVDKLHAQMMEIVSLSTPIGEDGDTELSDFVWDVTKESMENEIIHKMDSNLMFELVKHHTNEKEYDVICRRLGYGGYEPQTLEEVGNAYGVTRERIRQIESRGFTKLRRIKKLFEGFK